MVNYLLASERPYWYNTSSIINPDTKAQVSRPCPRFRVLLVPVSYSTVSCRTVIYRHCRIFLLFFLSRPLRERDAAASRVTNDTNGTIRYDIRHSRPSFLPVSYTVVSFRRSRPDGGKGRCGSCCLPTPLTLYIIGRLISP